MTDWLPELDDDDLTVLVEALEAWETKDQAASMMGELMGKLVAEINPRMGARAAPGFAQERAKRERAAAVRKERSVLLRAKLLTLRNRRRVESVVTRVPPPESA